MNLNYMKGYKLAMRQRKETSGDAKVIRKPRESLTIEKRQQRPGTTGPTGTAEREEGSYAIGIKKKLERTQSCVDCKWSWRAVKRAQSGCCC